MNQNQSKKNIFVELTATNDCNCNCSYCFEKCYSKKHITIYNYQNRTIQLIIDACKNFDKNKFEWFTVSFWGGEPFLNLEFIEEVIRNTYKFDFVRYNFFSNGTLVDKYKKFLSNNFIDEIRDRIHIQLSYDGEPHHSLKREDNKHLIFEVADMLKANSIRFDFKATLSFDMIKYLSQIWDSYYDLHSKYGSIVTYYPTLDTTKSDLKYFDDWKNSLLQVIKKEYDFIQKHHYALFGWLNDGRKGNCNLGNSLHIHTDGNIYICHGCAYKDNNENLKYGNINSINSLYDVLNDDFEINDVLKQCKECPATYCSVCHANSIKSDENPREKWFVCKVNNKSRCMFFRYFGYISKLLQYKLDNVMYMKAIQQEN